MPGCGGPVSGTPPLLYRTTWAARSRGPWVGRAQSLLNVFLARHRSGTPGCTDTSAATQQYLTRQRARLAAVGQDPLGVDCVFGEGTEIATLMFQACRGLVRDGKIGEQTWPHLLALETAPSPSPTPTPAPTPPPTPAPSGVRVRQDVWALSATDPWHPTLLWYARGVGALKARDGTTFADPRSWRHLAETHGNTVARASWPSGALWNQCEHNSWHFLPWHRAYLHHAEALLREAIAGLGGPADWALPYWDYSDATRPEVRRLPPAFRAQQLPGGGTNPLFVARRASSVNAGTPLDVVDVSTAAAFAEVAFTPPAGFTGGGFGGSRAPVGSHAGTASSQMGALEDTPHGAVHLAVGGSGGLMSSFGTAAQDPIFWLHHANIDRLWEAWLRAGSTRRNPAESAWADQGQWTFGAGPVRRTLRTRELLDPRRPPLGYRYADMPATPTPEAEDGWVDESEQQGPTDDRPPELVGASEGEVALGPATVSTRVRLGRPAGPAGERLEESRGVPTTVRVFLRLENIRATRVHASSVVVYLNIPPGGRPADFPDRRAGTLSLFGVVEASQRTATHSGSGRVKTLDVTRVARALATSGQWDPDAVTVSFVSVTGAAGTFDAGDVTVGRVSVFYA